MTPSEGVQTPTPPLAGVGTASMLSLPCVRRAPDRVNRPVPVPSVYVDGRGEIHNFSIGGGLGSSGGGGFATSAGTRINLLYTKAGVMRSGDIHRHSQRDFVFTGRVRVWTLDEKDGTTTNKREYGPNEYIEIPPYVPHLFEFVDDTVMAEWWDGPFEAWFYEPYRKIVAESTVAAASSDAGGQQGKGRFYHYVLQSQEGRTEAASGSADKSASRMVWLATGLAIGLGVGYAFGTSSSRRH